MRRFRDLITAVLASLVIGLFWWLAYTPPALALWAILGLHLLGGLAIYALLRALGWTGLAPLMSARVGALVLAPPMLVPFHLAGALGGPRGAVADVFIIGITVLICAGLGRIGQQRPGLAITVAVAGLAVDVAIVASVARRVPEQGALPTARTHADRGFGRGPVLIYGIDGADWQVLTPMMAAGELPHFAALLERGRGGILRSQKPMASPVLWTTIFSGMDPSTHGVDSWLRSDSRSRRVPMLWDALDAQGLSTLTVNVPGSWPPGRLDNGRLVVGFPIPGLTSRDTSHLLGSVLEGAGHHAVPVASPDIGARLQVGRVPVSNQLIDTLHRERLLPVAGSALELEITEPAAGRVLISGNFAQTLDLGVGETSSWLELDAGDVRALVQLHLLATEPLQLFVGPSFQDPVAPRHLIQTGFSEKDLALLGGEAPYVVEGIGWTAHRDERLAALVPELIFATQERQLELVEELLAVSTPDLVSVVFTAIDRVQHPYWSLHEPDLYADVWQPGENIRGRDYVLEAYRRADEGLGRLLALVPDDTTVFVVSDHGVSDADPLYDKTLGEAGHRLAGIWIAAGPRVRPARQALEMDVVDVMPTVLACIGAPLAEDLEGEPARICPRPTETVASYTAVAGAGASLVGAEQIEQIKSLGYME